MVVMVEADVVVGLVKMEVKMGLLKKLVSIYSRI